MGEIFGNVQRQSRTCVEALLGMLLPPVLVWMRRKKACNEFWINLVLTIFGWFGGILHAFWLDGVPCIHNICCLLLPPLGLYLSKKKCDSQIGICAVLCLTFFGAGWYAYTWYP